MSPPDIANFLAARSVAAATSFLAGRSDAAVLAREADGLCGELLLLGGHPECNAIADPARLLVVAMMRTAIAKGPRALRWRAVMSALVDLVRLEGMSMRKETVQRPDDTEILQEARAE